MIKKGHYHCSGECLNFKSYFENPEKLAKILYDKFANHFSKTHSEAKCLKYKNLPRQDKAYFRDQAKIVIFLFQKAITRPGNV